MTVQEDFHYYATYCAAYIAGYSHEESLRVAYAAQFVDCCTKTFINKVKGPKVAATTQLQTELADTKLDLAGLREITRIWASFHFLPGDLYAHIPRRPKVYMDEYRLICNPNGDLLVDTLRLAKGKGIEACGLAMHVLADTWAHRYFAGTPSFVINDAGEFYEIHRTLDGDEEKKIRFRHNPVAPDDLEKGIFTNSINNYTARSIMNLGHGRAGHLPDYSFAVYRYVPAWMNYEAVIKDNPVDYRDAFCQMIYAMKYLRGEHEKFEKERYDEENVASYSDRIDSILRKRQLSASEDWKAFGEELSGSKIPDFQVDMYVDEYLNAGETEKPSTFLGRFFTAAIAQKGMVSNRIYRSGNKRAGIVMDINTLENMNRRRLLMIANKTGKAGLDGKNKKNR